MTLSPGWSSCHDGAGWWLGDPSVLPHLTRHVDDGSGLLTSRAAAHAERGECADTALALLSTRPRWVQPGGTNALPTAAIKGQKAKEHPKTLLSLSCLGPIQPQEHKGTRKAKLVVSSIHSEEKLEEHESFLENPEEKIPSCFIFPALDIKSGQSAAVGRLCVLHNWGFFCGFFFQVMRSRTTTRSQKIN